MQPETELDEYVFEDCHLYKAENFIIAGMCYSDKLGKLCVLRKRADPKIEKSAKNQLFLIEIYNVIDAPCIFLEKSVPVTDTSVEAVVWMDDLVVGACFDGSLICISPFTTLFKRFQISPSPIWCITSLFPTQIAVGTDSGFIIFVERELEAPKEDVLLVVKKTFQLGFEQRILSIASSVKLSKIAAGSLDKIYLLEMNRQENKKVMLLAQENAKSTVPWSLIFVNESLLCGDSRGKVTIYNAKNGALLQTISTHEADILSMSSNGTFVFAAGIDFRIQVLKEIEVDNHRTEWATSGQKLIHNKEVRALACVRDGFLVSGGMESEILISNPLSKTYRPVKNPSISTTSNFNFLLFGYSNALELWHRCVKLPSSDELPTTKSKPIITPKKVCRLELGSKIISHAVLSHDAQFIFTATTSGLLVYRIRKDVFKFLRDSSRKKSVAQLRKDPGVVKKFGEIQLEQDVTAMISTSSAIFLACGEFCIRKVMIKENELKEAMFLDRAGMSSVRMLRVNQTESMLLALTLKNLLVIMDISSKTSKANEETIRTMQLDQLILDCRFFNNSSILFLQASIDCKLVVRQLEKGKTIGKPIANTSIFKKKGHEFGVSLSQVVNGSVVLTGSNGNFAIISELDQEKRLVKYEDKDKFQPNKEFSTPDRILTPTAFLIGKTILLC